MTEPEDKPRPMTMEDWHRIQGEMQTAQQRREDALLAAAKRLTQDYTGWQVLYPLNGESAHPAFPHLVWGARQTYLTLPATELPFMVQSYINMIETERTNRLCKCEWIVHPDDVDKPHGTRRIHKGQESPHCPVHTKLGFLLYFFDHYFNSKCPACPPDCKSCLFTRDCECYEHGNQYEEPPLPLKEWDGEGMSVMPAPVLPEDEITQDVTAVAHDN